MSVPRPLAAGRRLRTPRRPVLVVVGAVASLAVASVAVAVWTGGGRGTGAVRTADLDLAGTRPVVQAKGQDVSVSWTRGRLDGRTLGSHKGGGYLVRRYDAGGRSQEMRTACAGRMAGLAQVLRCVEHGVPEGSWRYAVTPVLDGWTGTEGPRTAVGVEAAAAVTVSAPEDGGATRDPRPAITGTAATRPGEPAQVTVTLSRGRDPGDVARRLTATVDQGAWSVRPAAPLRDGAYTVRAGQADREDHTTWSTPSTFLVDTTAPSTGDDSRKLGDGWHRTTQTVTLSPADPGGSGVAATYFTTDGSTPSTGSRRGTRVRFDTDGVHLLRVFFVDRAGNAEAVRTSGHVRIDRTAPDAAALGPLPDLVVDGHPLAWHRQPADGTYRVRARMLDKAANTTASDPRVVRVDNTPPEVTEITAGDGEVEAGDALVVSFSEPLDPAACRPPGGSPSAGPRPGRRPSTSPASPTGRSAPAPGPGSGAVPRSPTRAPSRWRATTTGSGSRSQGARPAAGGRRPAGPGRCASSRPSPSTTSRDIRRPARTRRLAPSF